MREVVRKAVVLLIALVLLVIPMQELRGKSLTEEETFLSKHGVYYQIFVRAFADGNGDGLGDLRGIIDRLDYLEELGVSGIWLTPIHPSPSYHKYDVTDFYAIDEEIGSLEDFEELVEKAHQRDIRVIMDLVLHHTSNLHPWFIAAGLDSESVYRDYYIWADPDTNLEMPGPWAQRVWHPHADGHYFGLFWEGMPDLNYDNPRVREEAKAIAEFWLERGVDGFRLDAAMHIYAHADTDRSVEWWVELREHLVGIKPDVYLVAEVWDKWTVVAPYYAAFDSCFNFDLANLIILSARGGSDFGLARVAERFTNRYKEYSEWVIDAPFLTNHDQDRLMSVLDDVHQAKMAASVYLTLPGNPFVYYGEEIGMKGSGPDENKREPFKWYELTGPGQSTWRASTFNTGSWQPSLEEQQQDADSIWNHYRNLIHLREGNLPLKVGSIVPIDTGNKQVVGFYREWKDQRVLVLHNLNPAWQEVELSLEDPQSWNVLHSDGEVEWGTSAITLSPRSSLVIEQ
ncbi:MAG: DUF3459 domain-containing protein [Firmicutes bacterium]|nr:DUF3459 domain-containing protein [Bacillota bacterium]